MKTGFLGAAALTFAPLLAVSALATQPETQTTAQTKVEEAPAEQSAPIEAAIPNADAPEPNAEEKRICRRVKLDMSSRRATRVCLTNEEWRQFNQQR